MDIIVLLNSRRRNIHVSLGSPGVAVTATVLVAVLAGAFYGGVRYTTARSADLLASIRARTASVWEDELAGQRRLLGEVKVNTEKSLDAMATRLSLLQGHVMRLDALGARLATMANVDDMEFGVDAPPGIGGPAPDLDQGAMGMGDLLVTLDQLETSLQDKAEKLSAMESMLIDRSLQEQTLPDGAPAPGSWLSSLYGYRTDPVSGRREFHQGIDLAGRAETPITAVAAGIVTWSGPRYGYGNLVEVSHGNGYLTRYAHNRKNLVSVGEKVEKGEIVALMGSSGRSTGTHVHFEVVRYGRHLDPRKHISLQ